jgi:putative ABC transport system ATP-binding protein
VPLIEIRELTKLYRMGDAVVRALDGVSLTIERGEYVAITGPSGSGKSTLMHLIGCLDRPTAGHYLLNGNDVSSLTGRRLAAVRNREIGFVFQTFNLINRTTALENVCVPLFYARQTNTREPARRALERVGLAHRAEHRPSELSGGERQRVAIARAIVNDPALLLADEPTGNLDSRTGEQIMEIVQLLNNQGVTIILVTHELGVAVRARRIIQMHDGRITFDGPTSELFGYQQRGASLPTLSASPAERPAMQPASVAAGGGVATLARPAAVARPSAPAAATAAQPPPAPAPAPAPKPPVRRNVVQGATGTLVCGAASLALVAATIVVIWQLQTRFNFATADPKALPQEALLYSGACFLSFLFALVLGIAAMVWSRVVLRRIRQDPQPDLWAGRGRAWTGFALGCCTLAVPLANIALGLIRRAF